jgi:hypothetical protein
MFHGAAGILAAACIATGARADVVISNAATQNMTCAAGVCSPTAAAAVLSITDVQTMLASGSLAIVTTNGDVQAGNIDVTAPFSWQTRGTLTLDANQSITFSGTVSDRGRGDLSLITDDGGSGGALTFLAGGNIAIADLLIRLTINGLHYHLVSSIKQLQYDIVAHPDLPYALANTYYAQSDGAYGISPINVPFGGTFTGLGNTVIGLEIDDFVDQYSGLFANVKASGTISAIRLSHLVVRGQTYVGGLVGINYGTVFNSSTSGVVQGGEAGGLVAENYGTIFRSSSSAVLTGDGGLGGLAADNYGSIDQSFATGRIIGLLPPQDARAGGLVGNDIGLIQDSYATGDVREQGVFTGGLSAFINEEYGGKIATSYATGALLAHRRPTGGGFLGEVYEYTDTIADCYWDTTTSGTTTGIASGSSTGITGLTSAQLQSALPTGFDPAIWTESPGVNNGFPYLIANPPLP